MSDDEEISEDLRKEQEEIKLEENEIKVAERRNKLERRNIEHRWKVEKEKKQKMTRVEDIKREQ